MLRKRSKALLSIFSALLLFSMVLMEASTAAAQGGDSHQKRPLPTDIDTLSLAEPATFREKISPQLAAETGKVEVVVRLSASPAGLMSDQLAQESAVSAEQDALIARIAQIDSSASVLGQLKILLNAVILEIDATRLTDLAQDARVVTINPVANFQLDLGQTVPAIGATPPVQSSVNGGAGVTVAVLDSGIDYTHIAFGGPGTSEAYANAYGSGPDDPRNTTLDGLFPTARVVGGYDFIGEAWPNGPLAPDPDPIDYDGHGTHVADIIAGQTPGAPGVAPGASLYAIKVCSAITGSCSGAAILQGLEYAVDPNQDGCTDDHVDILNMSFGSAYDNNYLDDLSTAVQHADQLGVLTVASAGNGGDRPYIVGTPATAPAAFAVAQTQAPGAKSYPLVYSSPLGIAGEFKNTTAIDWAPVGSGFAGSVAYIGRGCTTDTYLTSPAGKVALVDRGGCNVSEKVARASAAGAVGVLIAMTAPGDPTTFWDGGECPSPADGTCAPALVITLSDANQIKSILRSSTLSVSATAESAIALAGSVVSSSSRGPSSGEMFPGGLLAGQYGQLIKPEIGAPGSSVSARAGSGSGTEPFGGTSGAAPLVSGAAALLLADVWATSIPPRVAELLAVQHCSDKKARSVKISPQEIKARLMNTAETTIYTNPTTAPGVLAPITRIGGGEVRVDRAMEAGAAAWEFHGAGGSLSFGMIDVSTSTLDLYRVVEVKNYTGRRITYQVNSSFRYADDQENGAVTITPSRTIVTIPPYRSRYLLIKLQIDGGRLRPWTLSSGLTGGDPAALNQLEYDGYLTLSDHKNPQNDLHLAWQVLPRRSPNVQLNSQPAQGTSTPFSLTNQGLAGVSYATLPLLGENTTAPSAAVQGSQNPNITARYVGATSYTAAGTCSSGLLLRFGVKTWQPVTHASYPVEVGVYLDINRDGSADYKIYTAEQNGMDSFAGDGRNATYAGPVGGTYTSKFYTEHGTNSGVFIMSVCGEQVGLGSTDSGRVIDARFYTADNYITDDLISTISASLTILKDRYVALDPTSGAVLDQVGVTADAKTSYTMLDTGQNGSSAQGLLLLNTKGGTTEALTLGGTTTVAPSPTCQVGRRRWVYHCDDNFWQHWKHAGFFHWHRHWHH